MQTSQQQPQPDTKIMNDLTTVRDKITLCQSMLTHHYTSSSSSSTSTSSPDSINSNEAILTILGFLEACVPRLIELVQLATTQEGIFSNDETIISCLETNDALQKLLSDVEKGRDAFVGNAAAAAAASTNSSDFDLFDTITDSNTNMNMNTSSGNKTDNSATNSDLDDLLGDTTNSSSTKMATTTTSTLEQSLNDLLSFTTTPTTTTTTNPTNNNDDDVDALFDDFLSDRKPNTDF